MVEVYTLATNKTKQDKGGNSLGSTQLTWYPSVNRKGIDIK